MPTEPLQQRARSKIVATVGPACNSPQMLARLADAGADVFRLNTAHGTLAEHDEIHRRVRTLSDTIRPLGVLVDLAGPEIRLGALPGNIIACEQGASFEFIRGEQSADPRRLVCNYERLIDELQPGDDVLLADGTVHMVVTESHADRLVCEVVHEGTIRTRQGINLPGAKISLPALTQYDLTVRGMGGHQRGRFCQPQLRSQSRRADRVAGPAIPSWQRSAGDCQNRKTRSAR